MVFHRKVDSDLSGGFGSDFWSNSDFLLRSEGLDWKNLFPPVADMSPHIPILYHPPYMVDVQQIISIPDNTFDFVINKCRQLVVGAFMGKRSFYMVVRML